MRDEFASIRATSRSGSRVPASSSAVNLAHWGYRGPVQGMGDAAVLELRRHRLRFLDTPHVHHWDSMMVFEEHTRSLFPADLFLQPGDQPPVITEDLSDAMLETYRTVGIFAHEHPVRQVVGRVEELGPEWIHPMHGGSFTSDLAPRFYHSRTSIWYIGLRALKILSMGFPSQCSRSGFIGFSG